MGDFGEQHIGAEIAGPGLCLPPFIRPRLQPARIRRDELSIETSPSISEPSASLNIIYENRASGGIRRMT
jgi:hypothetical protein